MPDTNPAPRLVHQVMISSTFTDLKEHRAALIDALRGQGLADIAMENDSAKPDVDVIDSSLRMVRDASAYTLVISHKYGQTPADPQRNPDSLSLTELEFNEAQRLGWPILLFIMDAAHPVQVADVELDTAKREKLNAFRERAKQMTPGSEVHRVYATFASLPEFREKAIHAAAGLRRYLDQHPATTPADPIPAPPDLYAEPRYIGSHDFVGRTSELETLSDWAAAADQHPVLLFDAIGGSGKSMLTWEWTTKHATKVRADWAGRFWYSFYERGAIMADFCRHALAYMTRQHPDDFRKMKPPELGKLLLHQLQTRPWLLVLDGLERVLVAYQRFDAAQITDEEANQPTDQIAQRDPCAAIRPEDDDLLRALAGVTPSKVLITSRLVPHVFAPLNQTIPGVRRVLLPGLRPADAEKLLCSRGVRGGSQAIQNYLKSNCDCHPLVTGFLAGLVNGYLPDRGNFDAWEADAEAGGALNLADLDLVQRRNHILKAAIGALSEKSRQLLSTLALLSEAVDYPTLKAFNPHLPPEPEKVEEPREHESDQAALKRREEYEQAVQVRLRSHAPELADTVHDLEQRGLLQYDGQTKRYDLHPVVRGVAAGGLRAEEREGYGQRAVDYFSRQAHKPYDEAETFEDVRNGLHVVRTLLKMGRYQQACNAYRGELAWALLFNLEAYAETLSLLRQFFPQGWATLPDTVQESDASYLANEAAIALWNSGESVEALAAYRAALTAGIRGRTWSGLRANLSNISNVLGSQNRWAQEGRCCNLALELATLIARNDETFRARLDRFAHLATIGQWAEAQATWELLDPMGREWSRAIYGPGYAEYWHAYFLLWQGKLTEEDLAHAEQLARDGKDRTAVRALHQLRGEWHLERGEWELAAESLGEAVRMAREVGQIGAAAETDLALARFRLGELDDPRREAEQLASARWVSDLDLAELWLAIGEGDQAREQAQKAYKWAWADGEPYVWRYALNKARALLEQLGAEIPRLDPYDPAKHPKQPWEIEVETAIEQLRAEKEAENRKED